MNLFVAALRSAWAWPVAASLRIVGLTSVAEAVLALSCLRSLAADCRLEMSAQTEAPLLVVEPAAVVLLLDELAPPQPARSDATKPAIAIGTRSLWGTVSRSSIPGREGQDKP